MPMNFYQQYMESQKKMFEDWQNHMKMVFKDADPAAAMQANPFNQYKKMVESSQDFWKKVGAGSQSYQAVFELWKKLGESGPVLDRNTALNVYEEWSKQYFEFIRNNLIPSLPGYLNETTERLIESMESSNEKAIDYSKVWAKNDDALQKAFWEAVNKGPKGYTDFLDASRTFYDNTFGKLLSFPSFGRDMEFWERQKSIFDRFIKFNIATAEFYASLGEIALDATQKVLEEYVKMTADGTQPKTFDEFYKYWTKSVSAAYDKVLFSEELSVLSGKMVDAMSGFKMAFDKAWEAYLAPFPIPKKSDLDDLYKTVYELKKELKELRKEVRGNE